MKKGRVIEEPRVEVAQIKEMHLQNVQSEQAGPATIASRLSLWFLWFVIYSVIGWIFESIVVWADSGVLELRGFLYGPLLPIYGAPALLAIIISKHVNKVPHLLIIGSAIVFVAEYTVSAVLETLFGRLWWDYSYHILNFNGRVSLLSIAVFSAMIVMLIKFMHPRVQSLTNRIPEGRKIILASVFATYILLDLCITVFNLLSNG